MIDDSSEHGLPLLLKLHVPSKATSWSVLMEILFLLDLSPLKLPQGRRGLPRG